MDLPECSKPGVAIAQMAMPVAVNGTMLRHGLAATRPHGSGHLF